MWLVNGPFGVKKTKSICQNAIFIHGEGGGVRITKLVQASLTASRRRVSLIWERRLVSLDLPSHLRAWRECGRWERHERERRFGRGQQQAPSCHPISSDSTFFHGTKFYWLWDRLDDRCGWLPAKAGWLPGKKFINKNKIAFLALL